MASDRGRSALRSIHALFDAGTVGGLADRQLLERFVVRDGETAELAFAVLVERHGPMVLRVCRGVLRDGHDAEEAFQATFLILARKAGSIRQRDSLASWLHGVAYHVASNARSAAARRRSHEMKAGQVRPQIAAEPNLDDLETVVHEELAQLPGSYRAAIVLCCLEGLTQQQAAQHLGWPIGTVQSRLARGRERLRARLSRRGLAPSTAPALARLSDGAAPAMPAALADSTTRVASAAVAARALATGTVPVAVVTLAEGALRTMFLNQWKTTCGAALLAAGVLAAGATVAAYQNDSPAPTDGAAAEPEPTAVSPSLPDLVTVNGTVLMPDGSPAAGATVTSTAEREEAVDARTDATGRFQLRGVFGNGGRLHVRSAAGDHQTTLVVPSLAARTAFAAPIKLTLVPALTQIVAVEAAGRPVAGARVVAMGLGYKSRGVTDRDGRARLQLPARGNLQELVAWHPELGVSGLQDTENGLPRGTNRLSLLPPRPHRIRAVDPDGKPIAGLAFTASVKTEDSNWILMGELPAGRVRTDADGMVTLPWVPREKLKYVDIGILSSDWKIDEIDLTRIAEGITTIHARPERRVEGRLVMPKGTSAEGILITGFGFGPTNSGVIPYARARRDGTFTLRVPSEHAFVLGVSDLKWASDPWSGVIVGREGWKPSEIILKVYPATPLTVRVTRGPRHNPVVDAWVNLESRGEVAWTDAQGKKQTGQGAARAWLTTDAQGLARAGVGRGEQRLRLSSGRWSEERVVKVTSGEPVEVEFHRPWQGERKVNVRLMRDGTRYETSPTIVARAWTPQPPYLPLQFEPRTRPDGTFEVAFDAESLSLYFLDRANQRGGFARIGLEEAPVDVNMEATASYSGILLDEKGQPLADRALQLYVRTSPYEAVAPQQTDAAGRFRFPVVPANVPLQLTIRNEGDGAKYYLFDSDRLFQPGEVRENEHVKPQRENAPIARPPIPLAERVEKLCRDAGPSGMHGLVLLQGDDSQDVITLADRLLDEDQVKAVLSYLTLRLDVVRLETEAAVVADRGWPRPGPGEIVLVALAGDQTTIAASRIAAGERDASFGFGKDFLEQHRPPLRDARALLAEAREAAKKSGRRVWVVRSGPRCGPCFRLARWMADHHATLKKDYVIVKLMEGVDDHAAEVIAEFPVKPGDGVPWFAITEPDGRILATSEGPLGNIGFPSSVEGIRHLRQMLERSAPRLASDELDSLMKSLSPQP